MIKDVPVFYCCEEMRNLVEYDEYTIKEMCEILGIKYCPYCATKLSRFQ